MSETPHTVHRHDYRPPPFLVDTVALHFDLDPRATRVHARLQLRRNPHVPGDGPLRLDGDRLCPEAIAVDGTPLSVDAYQLDDGGLTVPGVPERFELATEVVINPAANTALMGLYQAGNLLCTQCEPEAFRRITFFPDRPDVLARYHVTLAADPARYPVLLANGNPAGATTLADGRHAVTWDDPFPKPSYLFALVAGDLTAVQRHVTTRTGRRVAVRMHVEPAEAGRCDHALDAICRAMTWDEAAYGREYDLDVFNAVAVSSYTMGAMENKSLNIFNDRYALASPGTATDRDHRDIEAMVAHELLHNWSGNRVTCRDWFQLALKEGFTVLREQQFIADQGWAAVRRIEDARLMRTRQFAEDAGPLAHCVRPDHYTEIENFYTDTVYSKGAEIWRMLRTVIGSEAFRRGCDRFFERHDGQAVTIEALVACLAEAADRDLTPFLAWFEQPGTPSLTVTGRFHPERAEYVLDVRQSRPPATPDAPPLPVPLALGLLGPDGSELPTRLAGDTEPTAGDRVLEIRETAQRFVFQDVPDRPVPALLRGFSAPVRIEAQLADEDLALLARHERDPVVRWDAVQALTARSLGPRIDGGHAESTEALLADVLRGMLETGSGDAGLDAELLALPSETAIAQPRPAVDVGAVHSAREGLRARLGSALVDALTAVYERCRVAEGAYAATHEAVSRRTLRDVCLGYLARPDNPDGLALCVRQYQQADNLTDAVSALALLADSDHEAREALLADFRERHRDRPLVLDKWLALQARSARPDTLERVRALRLDPVFSLTQPNRVRALVEVFAAENPLRFHRRDGAGYRFLAEHVRELDPLNPALAAALARHLSDWRGREPQRAAAMRRGLEGIAAARSLSAAVREVVDASLGEGAGAS